MDSFEGLDPGIADTLNSLNPSDEPEYEVSEAGLKDGLAVAEARQKWQAQSLRKLKGMKRALETESEKTTSDEELAEMIFIATAFDGEDNFILPEARELAKDCLVRVTTILRSCGAKHLSNAIRIVLNVRMKPLFLSSSHPGVNLSTGRKLHISNGSHPSTTDFYDDQTWKAEGQGCWNTLRWCIGNLEQSDFETLWPLLIPPLMTMLDDHDLYFRIAAIKILQILLHRVDGSLLKRTGIESLFAASLSISVTYYNDAEAPKLLLEAIKCSQQLIELTTPPGSRERFERICDMATKAVIGGAWLYAGDNLLIMEASVQALIPVVSTMGIGTCRFLKALIPQLSENLIPKPSLPHSHRLLQLSADCLIIVIEVCKPRIYPWKGAILEGLLRAWVYSQTDGIRDPDNTSFQQRLLSLRSTLQTACPGLVDNEFRKALACDKCMFEELLLPSTVGVEGKAGSVEPTASFVKDLDT
ncbi:hypothetical protein FRB93_001915 [Tulasnella sp. JGI-2019a]|nr:hypothetical protein FRB93_001915 [Tulasnella sp. JGI-2019a]